ncbi:MFS transporter [Chloroflexota bacterium]
MSGTTSQVDTGQGSGHSGRYLWIPLFLVTGATVSLALMRQGIPVLYPFIQDFFGLSRAQIGLITTAQASGFAAASMLAGWLTDKYGVKRMISASLFILTAFTLIFPLVSSFFGIIALAVVIGIITSPLHPAATRAIIDWFPGKIRALAMSVKQMGVPIGGALAAAVFPALAIAVGWRMAAAVTGLLVLLIAVIFVLRYRDAARETKEVHKFDAATVKTILRDRGLMTTILWGAMFIGLQHTVLSYLMLFVIEALEVSPIIAGGLLAIAQVSSIFARVFWGAASDFIFHRQRIVVLAITGFLTVLWMTGVSFIGVGVPSSLIYLIAILIGISTLSFHGVFITAIGEQAKTGQIGVTVGLSTTINSIVQMLTPPLFGYLVDITDSYRLVWRGTAAVAFLSTLALIVFTRQLTDKSTDS